MDVTQFILGAWSGSVITAAIIQLKGKARAAAADERLREMIRAELAIFRADFKDELLAMLNSEAQRLSVSKARAGEPCRKLFAVAKGE